MVAHGALQELYHQSVSLKSRPRSCQPAFSTAAKPRLWAQVGAKQFLTSPSLRHRPLVFLEVVVQLPLKIYYKSSLSLFMVSTRFMLRLLLQDLASAPDISWLKVHAQGFDAPLVEQTDLQA